MDKPAKKLKTVEDSQEDLLLIGDGIFLKQNPDEKKTREIRNNYRQLIADIDGDKCDLINPESDILNDRLKKADELYKSVSVKMPREAALDAQALVKIANVGRQKAQALNTEFAKFQPFEFVEKMKTFLCGNILEDRNISKEKWCCLGKAVHVFFKSSPPFRFMNGSFERGKMQERKERVVKIKEKDNVVDKATIPEQIQVMKDKDKMEATTVEVERIFVILRDCYENISKNNPLCFFEFITNPHSFGQTIENIFHVSFLVRDGLVRISLDEDLLPVIEPIDKSESNKNVEKNSPSIQVIISMTPSEWKEIVKTFCIKGCVIPNRKTWNE